LPVLYQDIGPPGVAVDEPHITRHSLSDVWQAIGKQSDDIATIRAGQAALDARVDHGFQNLSAQLQGIVGRVNQPAPQPDVKGWIAIAVSLVLALGAVGFSNLQPVKENTDKNRELILELMRQQAIAEGRHIERDLWRQAGPRP
jgi:hypothetical protein